MRLAWLPTRSLRAASAAASLGNGFSQSGLTVSSTFCESGYLPLVSFASAFSCRTQTSVSPAERSCSQRAIVRGRYSASLLLPVLGAEDRPADDHFEPLAHRFGDVAHRGDQQPALDGRKRGHFGVHLAPVPADQHRVFGVEAEDDLQMVDVGAQRRRGRRGRGRSASSRTRPSPLLLPAPNQKRPSRSSWSR